jgi:hypothetical protein
MKPRSFKQFGKVIGSAILLALTVEAGLILPEAQAAQNEVVVRVVQNDRGGVVGRRAEEINVNGGAILGHGSGAVVVSRAA